MGIVDSIGYSEPSAPSPTGRSDRVAVFALLLVEPFVLVALLLAAVAATFALIGSGSHSRALDAIVVPLVVSVACCLLNMRLEHRALAQERSLLELFVALGGDPAGALAPRAQTARERVDAKAPLLRLTAQDLLGMVSEAPCRTTRATLAWVALVCVLASVARWVWRVVLYAGGVSATIGPLIAACLLLFALAWNDLRHGRARSLHHPRQVRLWGAGRHPQRPPLVLPSLPTMSIMFVPAGLLGVTWAAGASLSSRVNVTEAVFGFWLAAWNGRAAVTSTAFRRFEARTARADALIRHYVMPVSDLVARVCRWGLWGSASLFALALTWPRALGVGAQETLTDASAWFLTASLALGLFVAFHWQRPLAPRTYSGEQLLDELSEAQVRRISVCSNVGLATTMLLIALVGVPV